MRTFSALLNQLHINPSIPICKNEKYHLVRIRDTQQKLNKKAKNKWQRKEMGKVPSPRTFCSRIMDQGSSKTPVQPAIEQIPHAPLARSSDWTGLVSVPTSTPSKRFFTISSNELPCLALRCV